jgi:hypothetical protein
LTQQGSPFASANPWLIVESLGRDEPNVHFIYEDGFLWTSEIPAMLKQKRKQMRTKQEHLQVGYHEMILKG